MIGNTINITLRAEIIVGGGMVASKSLRTDIHIKKAMDMIGLLWYGTSP